MPFFNTKDVGPMVIEIPPADDGVINGSIMDPWQAALEDVGPAGVDKGKGGKYLILPPGYKEKVPDGYIALPSATYQGYALLRSILKSGSDADVAKRRSPTASGSSSIRFSQAANPPATVFVDADRRRLRLHHPLRPALLPVARPLGAEEPWLTRDKAMIDQLKSIGIEKGKPFGPDDEDARTY